MKQYHSKKYLIEQLKSKDYKQIAQDNNVSIDAIQYHMDKHGLTKRLIPWTEKEIELLRKNYGANPHVYNLFPSRTISSVNHKASRLGLPKIVRKRIYDLNHDFFKEWSPEMAYVLGFFFSDGEVSSDLRFVRIHLHKKDHLILEKINRLFESKRPIGNYKEASMLRLNSLILVKYLINLGCVPRKSLVLKFPKIKDEYLSHFVRGYFDGDGSIHFNKPNTIKITFVGTKEFIEELQRRLNRSLKIKINPIYKDKKIYVCRYYSEDARKLGEWMYKNSKSLYLYRKKDRFDKHMRVRNGRI